MSRSNISTDQQHTHDHQSISTSFQHIIGIGSVLLTLNQLIPRNVHRRPVKDRPTHSNWEFPTHKTGNHCTIQSICFIIQNLFYQIWMHSLFITEKSKIEIHIIRVEWKITVFLVTCKALLCYWKFHHVLHIRPRQSIVSGSIPKLKHAHQIQLQWRNKHTWVKLPCAQCLTICAKVNLNSLLIWSQNFEQSCSTFSVINLVQAQE